MNYDVLTCSTVFFVTTSIIGNILGFVSSVNTIRGDTTNEAIAIAQMSLACISWFFLLPMFAVLFAEVHRLREEYTKVPRSERNMVGSTDDGHDVPPPRFLWMEFALDHTD
jgi:hypothetical protein